MNPRRRRIDRVLRNLGSLFGIGAVIAHTGWHWMTERWEDVARIGVPAPSLESAAVALAWLAAGVLLAAVAAAIVDRLGLGPGGRAAGGTRLAAQAPGDD